MGIDYILSLRPLTFSRWSSRKK